MRGIKRSFRLLKLFWWVSQAPSVTVTKRTPASISRRQALEQPEPVDPGAKGRVGREQAGPPIGARLDRVAEPQVLGAAIPRLEGVGIGRDRH